MNDQDTFAADEMIASPDDEASLAQAGPETFDLELDGEVHTLPAALKGAFLRQADYTRKTQDLAEHRRAVETERQALAQEAHAHRGASQDRIRLAALDHQLDAFEGVDWEAYAAADPEGARTSWAAAQRLGEARAQLAGAISHHEARAELKAAREAAEAMTETGRQLRQEIEGWSPDIAARLVDYAQAFGVTLEELGQTADPRLWKLLHKAWRADEAEQGAAREQAQAIRPAVTMTGGGAGAGGVRDELGTKEWMRRRNEQMARR